MQKAYFIFILSFFFLFTYYALSGQDKQVYSQNIDEDEFLVMLDKPSEFTSEERNEIYLKHASSSLRHGVDSSLQVYQEMLAFGQRLGDNLMIGAANGSLSQLYSMKGNTKLSLQHSKESIVFLKDYPQYLASSYRKVVSVFTKMDQLDSAEYYLDSVFFHIERYNDSMDYSVSYILKAKVLKKQNRLVSAIENYQIALMFIGEANSKLIHVNAHRGIAELYARINDFENAIYHGKQALTIAETNNYSRSTADMQVYLAKYHLDDGNSEEAISLFEKALPYRVEKSIDFKLYYQYALMARAYVQSGNLSEAQLLLSKAASLHNKNRPIDSKAAYFNAQGMYYNVVSPKQAKPYLDSLLLLGEGSLKIRSLAYQGLKEYYSKTGDLSQSIQCSDSLLDLERRDNILARENFVYDYETKYKKVLQDKEISSLKTKQTLDQLTLKQKDNQLLISLLSLLFALGVAFALFYFFRLKSRNNSILTEKNIALSKSLSTNKMLIKEIHHRVKNNLQVVSSLLNLQSRYEQNDGILEAINTGKNRVQSMSLLHQNLYVNENLKSIKVKNYFSELAENLVEGYPLNGKEIELHLDVDDIEMDIDTVVPLGLITNELITNALKYAFKDQDLFKLSLLLKQHGDKIKLSVSDNGEGLPFDELPERSTSMGVQLIKSFSSKIKAMIEIDNSSGAKVTLTFDYINAAANG